jgi:hypothetical protein
MVFFLCFQDGWWCFDVDFYGIFTMNKDQDKIVDKQDLMSKVGFECEITSRW